MKYPKFKSIIAIGMGSLLAGALATTAFSEGSSDSQPLSKEQIFKNVKNAYADLSSYRDSGQVSITVDASTRVTRFMTKLAKPDMYLIEWTRSKTQMDFLLDPNTRAAWSTGAGNFYQFGYGIQKTGDLKIALAESEVSSRGASLTVPQAFFDLSREDDPDSIQNYLYDEQRLPDQKVGDVDCYVFQRELIGKKRTIWIGKDDFLIRQVRTIISPDTNRVNLDGLTPDSIKTSSYLHEYAITETHDHIVLNPTFKKADLLPTMPQFIAPNDTGDSTEE